MSYISTNPHNGEETFKRPFSSKDETKAQIQRIYKAFRSRLTMDGFDKPKLKQNLQTIHALIAERKESIAQILTEEVGKPITEAGQEVDKVLKHLKWFTENLEELTKSKEIPTEGAMMSGYHIDPLGIIMIVVPFNFPFWTSFRVLVPTLCAGNGILMRMAGNCGRMGEAIATLFKDAGLDHCDVAFSNTEDTDFILQQKEIQGLHFTGSTKIGGQLAALCGKNLKRSSMELGGNDAFIVLHDANCDFAVDKAISYRLRNCGQVCTSGKRIIIHQSLYASFVDKLKQKVEAMKIGDPKLKETQLGPLVKASAAKKVHEQVHQTLKTGDILIFGGEAPNGCYYKPTCVKVNDFKKSYASQEEVLWTGIHYRCVQHRGRSNRNGQRKQVRIGCNHNNR